MMFLFFISSVMIIYLGGAWAGYKQGFNDCKKQYEEYLEEQRKLEKKQQINK